MSLKTVCKVDIPHPKKKNVIDKLKIKLKKREIYALMHNANYFYFLC